jgi:hypothetical protein
MMGSEVNREIREYIAKHGGLNGKKIGDLAEQFDVNYDVVRGVYRRWKRNKIRPKKAKQEFVACPTESVDSLVQSLDVSSSVLKALDEIPYKEYVDDETFRRRFSVGNDRWKNTIRKPEFDVYKVVLPNRRFIWCSIETAEYLRKRLEEI